MAEVVNIRVDGRPIQAPAGSVVAVALALARSTGFRRSVAGERRGPLCGMGVCFECRVTINGRPHQRSCWVVCEEGMEVQTDE